MVTKSNNKFKLWWIVPIVLILVIGIFVFRTYSNRFDTSYKDYTNDTYGFSVEYPAGWEVKTDTHVFENGDIVAFQVKGLTQKRYTEFIDGARFIISKPFNIDTDLKTWMKSHFSSQAKFSKLIPAKYPFEEVEDCSNSGCMRYYFTTINNQVYGVHLFAEGASEEKAAYENALLYMFKSLQFANTTSGKLTNEKAVVRVRAFSEVVNYLKRIPNGLVEVNGEDDTNYMVQVYEIKDGHTATFNWYTVDKTTGEVKKEF